jgi:biotin carboxyl carrier protein
MKRFMEGVEVELDESAAQVSAAGDRLMVYGADGAHSAVAVHHGGAVLVSYKGHQYRVERKSARARHHGTSSSGEIRAPMPGSIVDVRAAKGDSVEKGDTLLVLEAMKTQQPFVAPFTGIVKDVLVARGDQVSDGQLMAVVEELEALTFGSSRSVPAMVCRTRRFPSPPRPSLHSFASWRTRDSRRSKPRASFRPSGSRS